jgi:hypothetical protein
MEPTHVYRCPGTHSRKGGTFDYRGVTTDAQLSEALEDGWYETLPEAIAAVEGSSGETQAAPAPTLRTDGPTVAEFVEAGYDPRDYPPQGFASISSDEEINAATAELFKQHASDALGAERDQLAEERAAFEKEKADFEEAQRAAAAKDDAPPTREELEAQATELDIVFDGRTSDAKLKERIDEALAK